MSHQIFWQHKFFGELTAHQLYAIGRLRQEIFVVEQNCPYLDFDNKDQNCWHVMGWDDNSKLVAYARLCPKRSNYPDAISIGRVLVAASMRG